MNAVFVDTSFYAAIINRRDQWHARSVEVAAVLKRPMITSEFVLLEVANFCTKGRDRQIFLRLTDFLRNNAETEVVPANTDDFQRGLDLFATRDDKGWSLTDCISFAMMQIRQLTDALTADEHFLQAGFRALLRE